MEGHEDFTKGPRTELFNQFIVLCDGCIDHKYPSMEVLKLNQLKKQFVLGLQYDCSLSIIEYQIICQMLNTNILYEVKKEANKRSSPYFVPNSEDDDIREENKNLRTKIRSQQTQIIRLNAKIDELSGKIAAFYNANNQEGEQTKKQVNTLSKLPMLMENKQLKESNEILHQENLMLNGKNNEIQSELRQIKSDNYQLELKLKELNILEKMREERFKDQLQRLTPVVIEEPSDFTAIKDATTYLTKFLRQRIFGVTYNLFLSSAKQCEGKKKVNSYTIFLNFWSELKAQKNYGFLAILTSYKAICRVMKIVDEHYGEIDEEDLRGTINDWILESMVEIRNTNVKKEKERKLFRMLGLAYRSKFPIKGEKYEMTEDVKDYLQNAICLEALRLMTEE